jgi:hypothetical protein
MSGSIHIGWLVIILIVLGALYYWKHQPMPTQQ